MGKPGGRASKPIGGLIWWHPDIGGLTCGHPSIDGLGGGVSNPEKYVIELYIRKL